MHNLGAVGAVLAILECADTARKQRMDSQDLNNLQEILDQDMNTGMQSQDLVAAALANALQTPVELQQYTSDEIDAVPGPPCGTPQRQGGSKPQRRKAPATTQQGGPTPKKKKADTVRTDEDCSNRQRVFCTLVYESMARMKKREMMLEKERQALQVESEQLYNMIDQYACEAIKRFNTYSDCGSTIMQVGGILPEQGSEVNVIRELSGTAIC
ncbi:UNVERIFIED_CONTAM: hypothetical protein K2H54_054976 [Gekko kuhli]